MGFNTLSFIPFLLLFILLYFTIFRKCQWVFLLLASIVFYLFAGPKYIIFIFISSLSTYTLARKIQKFLSQPFHVAENFTGIKGVYVPLKETIRGFKAILDGEMDEYPENAFFNAGTIEDVRKKAEQMEQNA